MLKFGQIPPTVEGTEIDPGVVRFLAYSVENRCLNNVAEACASVVIANTIDLEVIKGIGEKAGDTIAKSRRSLYPRDDGECFTYRYDDVVMSLLKGDVRKKYTQMVKEARKREESELV